MTASETRGIIKGNDNMPDVRKVGHDILARGRVDGRQLEVLRRLLYAGGNIERPGADFLVELH